MAGPDSFSTGAIEVRLDGIAVEIPAERRSFTAIRSYLESLALQQQRIVCALNVDGESVNLTQSRMDSRPFSHVEAETMSLAEVPLQLVKAALQQATTLRTRVHMAIELVLINSPRQACELWWQLSVGLKEPLLTLSLIPDHQACGNGSASLSQLRRWQLQQLGCIIQDVETASQSEDTTVLSDALEKRALPWLDALLESLNLWNETLGNRTQSACDKV
jgi:hypothetical protein